MAAPIDPRLLKRAKATRSFLLCLVLAGVATGALVLGQAWLISQNVAKVFYTHQVSGLGLPVMLIALIFFARAGINWLNEWLAHRAGAAVKSKLRRDIMAAKLANPMDSSVSSASLINLVTTNLNDLDNYYAKFMPQLVLACIVPVMLVIPIYSVDFLSGLLITITVPLIPIFMILIGINTKIQVNRRFKVQYRLANHFADLIQGLPTLQAFGRAKAQSSGLKKTEDANRIETMRTLVISFLSAGVLELTATLSVALVAVTIGLRVVAGDLDLYTSLFVLVLAPEVYLPIRLVGTHFHDSQNGMQAASRAFAVIEAGEAVLARRDELADRAETSATDIKDHDGIGQVGVVFDQVGFSYPNTTNPVLTDFNMEVTPGKVTALVGRTGAGKSTVLSLLMGFNHPTDGRILVCESGVCQDLAAIEQKRWLTSVAWVGQNPGMVAGTIRDNVALGFNSAGYLAGNKAELGEAERDQLIRQALDSAGGKDLALDHLVCDDGEGLSAGERRRVGVARALLKLKFGPAKLLVLDEPTAGLDADAEAELIATVKDLGCSILVVSHREAVISMADSVVEL